MFEEVAVKIHDILAYLGVGHGESIFEEGEAILDHELLVMCALTARSYQEVKVLGLCLESPSSDCERYEMRINVDFYGSPKITGTCSCNAGLGRCKHVMAALLRLTRTPIDKLEDLTDDDITQMEGWTQFVAEAVFGPRAGPFCEAHAKPRQASPIQSSNVSSQILNTLLKGAPDSVLAMHLAGCGPSDAVIKTENQAD